LHCNRNHWGIVKMKKLFWFAAVAAVAGSLLAPTSGANASIFTVEAISDMSHWLDTGITLNSATTYDFAVVNPSTIWSAGGPPNRDSTANGIDPVFYTPPTITFDGFTGTFKFGALVGLDSTGFFLIGTGPTALSGLSGDLKVGYWDTFYGDNTGSQTLSITTGVPELSTWALMILGFCGVGFIAYRRKQGGPSLRLA
jgi:hypothetical protein